ncbi:MAG TPA: mannosyltransferase family protein [Thermomicrobiales bacterium]|nr:mannosyltransferase family protein [Thermomicrobiales bacterium]
MFGSQVKRLAATIVDAPPRVPATTSEPPTTRERLLRLLAREDVRVPLAVFVLSRLYVFLLGAIAMQINVMLAPVPALGYYMPPLYGLEHYLLQPWRNWDGHWYALIALEGYGYDRAVTAFYPLYPLLLHWGAWLLDGRLVLAGVLISNVCFLAALVLLYRLLAEDFSASVARRALVLLALFPTAYYFTAVYSESLFLLLAVGAFYAARHNWWWAAGLCGFLATLTRVHGILLVLPLGILFLKQQGWNPRRWRANPISLTLVPAGLLVYMAYLRRVWDDPLVLLKAQKGWDRYQATPLQTLIDGVKQVNGCAVRGWPGANVDACWWQQVVQHPSLETVRTLGWRWGLSESNVTELAFTILLIALGLAAFRLLPLAYSSYLAAGIILPLWSPSKVHALMSMGRFALILFPAFIVLALVARRRPVYAALVVVSALLLAFFAIQFASWFWVA